MFLACFKVTEGAAVLSRPVGLTSPGLDLAVITRKTAATCVLHTNSKLSLGMQRL